MVEWRWSSILPQIPNGGRQGAKRNLTTQTNSEPSAQHRPMTLDRTPSTIELMARALSHVAFPG
jgi:hypothetical protein